MAVAFASAARAAITLSVSPDTVAVAEPVTVTLASDGGAVIWPEWDAALPGWDVVTESVSDTEARLTLRSYLPGEVEVPALAVATAGGVSFITEPRAVAVTSVLADEVDVADAESLRPAADALRVFPRRRWTGVGTLVAEFLAAAAGVVGFFWWRRRRARKRAPAAEVDRALDAADRNQDPRPAVWAVRRAAELASGQRLAHLTTAELGVDPGLSRAVSAPLYEKIKGFLQDADHARHGPTDKARGQEVVVAARKLVQAIREHAASTPNGKEVAP